jgi:tetratricopeptide (TPR) repeat protein
MKQERATGRQPAAASSRRRQLQPDEWARVDDLQHEATDAVDRGRHAESHVPERAAPAPSRRSGRNGAEATPDPAEGVAASVRGELEQAVGPARAPRYEQRMKDASRAFRAERFGDAVRILRKLSEDAPGAAAVRELHGLTLYRLGRWRPAIRELEAFRTLSGSTEQHPVLADCYRAINQHEVVSELWDELRSASPSAELVTEGRIVYAGSLADRGDLPGAIKLLEQGFAIPKRAQVHHLRRAYALADAYERAGDVVRARELFFRVASYDRDFADVTRRARALN